jgi:ABC-type cobalamin/Fe3+-siderophores transport system ATPase subunit
MSVVSLELPANDLFKQPQTLVFEKIATFIGGNGSGKSTILKSIFDEKLKPGSTLYQDYKIVCFSSGQNESYSERFASYLNTERKDKRALNLDCFYYDKSLAKLLIFLSSTSIHNGLVRNFLKHNNYIVESEFDEDDTTKISFDVKVDKAYTNLVKQAYEAEAKGNSDVITNKAYHQTLRNFINTLVDESYDFTEPLELTSIQLSQSTISNVSFETDEHTSFDSKIMFFTQAADNDYFIVKSSFDIEFLKTAKVEGEENKVLRLEDLSDGEYQLLFLYALVDLFDRDNTLFLFDEADSHLHYKNIDNLWSALKKLSGKVITTTHLLDSISKAGIEKLKVVEGGFIQNNDSAFRLTQRLEALSDVQSIQIKLVSMYKNAVLMDHAHDWEIFKLLVLKKLGVDGKSTTKILQVLSSFICLSVSSGYKEEYEKKKFADNKITWLSNFENNYKYLDCRTRNVFMICDRDDYPINLIGTPNNPLIVNKHEYFTPKKAKDKKKENSRSLSNTSLLSWRRREIKHYLLSATALKDLCVDINIKLHPHEQLKANNNGDSDDFGTFNNSLAKLSSTLVKGIVDPLVNRGGQGFCVEKTQRLVSRIPRDEISDDIAELYNYLEAVNESK